MSDCLRLALLLLVAIGATQVVRETQPLRQVLALAAYGLIFALLFVVYQAPDVALSQVVVGAVVLPLLVLLALTTIRKQSRGEDPHG